MKSISKSIGIAVLTAAIVLSMVSCDSGTGSPGVNGKATNSTHFVSSIEIESQQVWEQNKSAVKISEAYKTFGGNRSITITIFSPVDFSGIQIGSGYIKNGIMTFSVNEPEPENLFAWNDFKRIFSCWNDVAVDTPHIRGNFIMFSTPEGERLNRERILGINSSLGQETILFLYVDNDCHITGSYGDGQLENRYYYTENTLALLLKKGWNTICHKESYGQSGKAAISMEIKNPSGFKWVLCN